MNNQQTQTKPTKPQTPSPEWSRTTKTVVAIAGIIILVILLWRFQSLLQQVIIAAMIAYVLNPIVKTIDARTPLKRGPTIILAYIVMLILLIGAFIAIGLAAYNQGQSLLQQLPDLITQGLTLIQDSTTNPDPWISFGSFEFGLNDLNFDTIQDQLIGLVQPLLGRGGQLASSIAGLTFRFLGNFLFIFFVSIYLANEIPELGNYVGRVAAPPGYRQDAQRLLREFGRIWSAYLRGQIVLGIVIFLVVSITLSALGVQNALALGALAGFLEFVPNLGPILSTVIAMLVAFFQPENYLGLTSAQFTIAVLILMFLIQQLENNILVPRIVGEALDLHPLLVIIGVFMGGSVAGILGAVLAAPVLASLKLVTIYAWRKMFDLPPFPKPESEDPLPSVWQRLRSLVAPQPKEEPVPTETATSETPDE